MLTLPVSASANALKPLSAAQPRFWCLKKVGPPCSHDDGRGERGWSQLTAVQRFSVSWVGGAEEQRRLGASPPSTFLSSDTELQADPDFMVWSVSVIGGGVMGGGAQQRQQQGSERLGMKSPHYLHHRSCKLSRVSAWVCFQSIWFSRAGFSWS